MLELDNDAGKVMMSARICTIADAERNRSADCQKLKKAPHLRAGLSACLLGKRREAFQ